MYDFSIDQYGEFRCMGTPLCISSIFTKGNNFCNFLFASLTIGETDGCSLKLCNSGECIMVKEQFSILVNTIKS